MISFSNNEIQSFEENTFQDQNENCIINIDNNPLECCKSYSAFSEIKNPAFTIMCNGNVTYSSNSYNDLCKPASFLTNNNDVNDNWLMIGCVIGSVVIVMIVVGAIVFVILKKKRKTDLLHGRSAISFVLDVNKNTETEINSDYNDVKYVENDEFKDQGNDNSNSNISAFGYHNPHKELNYYNIDENEIGFENENGFHDYNNVDENENGFHDNVNEQAIKPEEYVNLSQNVHTKHEQANVELGSGLSLVSKVDPNTNTNGYKCTTADLNSVPDEYSPVDEQYNYAQPKVTEEYSPVDGILTS
eukprot:Pgem_evm1s17242